jgi:hypothetical protein
MASEIQEINSITLGNLALAAVWITGIILAQGFWNTLGAIVCPFWGLYLIIDHWLVPLI